MFAFHETPHAESATTPSHVAPLPWTILVVDADDEARSLYRQSLTLVGCEVVEASDGREALTIALVRPPTLVVTEITLPFVDGYALCEILRCDRTTADIPILVVTAESRPAQLHRARKAGADIVLVKPTPIENVLSEVHRLASDSRSPHERAVAPKPNLASRYDDSRSAITPIEQPRRTTRAKSFPRFTTTTPAKSPPPLVCPSCDGRLTYEQSHIGGVNDDQPEQWDLYVCPASCGTFQYRHRTRKLRRVE
jgi:CheY-like chemotaxis protein